MNEKWLTFDQSRSSKWIMSIKEIEENWDVNLIYFMFKILYVST